MTILRALTVSEPFASMIAGGEKLIENRKWQTDYRGLLAIHAGKGTQYLTRYELRRYPAGCVLAVVRLVSCIYKPYAVEEYAARRAPYHLRRDGLTRCDLGRILDDVHAEGPYLWILADLAPFRQPIPARGAQGLWGWTAPDNWPELVETPSSD